MMEIRKATLADPALAEFFDGSLRCKAELQPGQYRPAPQDMEFVQAGILQENADILVAEEQGKLLGMVSLFAEETNQRPYRVFQRYVELNTIYVLPEYRSRGIGTSLMNAAKSWAKERGISTIELMALGEMSGGGNSMKISACGNTTSSIG